MRTLLAAAVLLLASCASDSGTRLGVAVGLRNLDSGDWGPVDDQGVVGLELVHERPESLFGFEAAILVAEREVDDHFVSPTLTVDARGRTEELSLGLHKSIRVEYGGVHPYVGGGLSLLRAELRGDAGGVEDEDDDASLGAYVRAGVDFDVTPAITLGLDLRGRAGEDASILGGGTSTGYGQLAVILGFRF